MKLSLSKSQWEQIGKTAGWTKTAGIDEDISDVYGLIKPFAELVSKYGLERGYYAIDPNNYEDYEIMRREVRRAEAFVAAFKQAMATANRFTVDAEQAIESLRHEYGAEPQHEYEDEDAHLSG